MKSKTSNPKKHEVIDLSNNINFTATALKSSVVVNGYLFVELPISPAEFIEWKEDVVCNDLH